MAGHEMFHNATAHFTSGFVSSLPRQLIQYADVIKSTFKLLLIESEKGYACSGAIKDVARFSEDFPKYVSDEEKRAIGKLVQDGNKNSKGNVMMPVLMNCPLCEYETRDVTAYREHIRHHKAKSGKGGQLRFTCAKCQYKKHFETKDLNAYIRHLRSIHGNVKAVLCELCGLSFKRADALQNHQTTIHGPGAKRRHRCEQCNKSFQRKGHLITHYQTHVSAKKFSCERCKTMFKTEAAREKHIEYKHTNPMSFKCDKCSRGFCTKQNLNAHLAVHEREMSFDAEGHAKAIREHIALHIQTQIENTDKVHAPTDDVNMDSYSVPQSSVASPARQDPSTSVEGDTVSNNSLTPALGDSQPPVENLSSVTSLPLYTSLPCTPAPIYPSRPASVASQYTGFNDPPPHDDSDKVLDEIFPEKAEEELEENLANQYVSESHQEELDSVFRPDVVHSDPSTLLSRPPSVSSRHTEFTEAMPQTGQVIDGLLHYTPSVSADVAAAASPQSVCSSQFPHQSRPPSVGSQHSTYHDQTASLPVPQYAYSIRPPEIVFNQSMNCTSDLSHAHTNMAVITNTYDKSVPPVSLPSQQSMHYVGDHNATTSSMDNNLMSVPCSYQASLHHAQSCFTDPYVTTPHYTNTPSQECVTIQSTTRCVTPQNFASYNHASADGSRPPDDFGNHLTTDTLLLPTPVPTNQLVTELHTPNKNFPDNGFSDMLSYASSNDHPSNDNVCV